MKHTQRDVCAGSSARNGEKTTGTPWKSPFYNVFGGQSHEMRTANTRILVGIADSWWETPGCNMFSNWFNCTINRICIWQPAQIRHCDWLIPTNCMKIGTSNELYWLRQHKYDLLMAKVSHQFQKYSTEKDNNLVRGLCCSLKRICVIVGVIQSVSAHNTWLLLLRKMPEMISNKITWCVHHLCTNCFHAK